MHFWILFYFLSGIYFQNKDGTLELEIGIWRCAESLHKAGIAKAIVENIFIEFSITETITLCFF